MYEFDSIFHEETFVNEGVSDLFKTIKSMFGKSPTTSKIKKGEIKSDDIERNFSSLSDQEKNSIEEFYNEGDIKKLSEYTLTKSKLSEDNNYYKIALVYSINSLSINAAVKKSKCKAYYTFYKDICFIVIDGGNNNYIYYLPIINTDPDPESSVLLFVKK